MPWPIRLLDKPPPWTQRRVGDAWWAPPTGADSAWHTSVGSRHGPMERVRKYLDDGSIA